MHGELGPKGEKINEDVAMTAFDSLKDIPFDPEAAKRAVAEAKANGMIKDADAPYREAYAIIDRYEKANKPENKEQGEKELFSRIESPLDDEQSFDAIIDAYAKPNGIFYNNLQNAHLEQKESGVEDVEGRQAFEQKMFKRWKESVLKIPEDQATESQKYVASYLRAMPDAKSIYELGDQIKQAYPGETGDKVFQYIKDHGWSLEDNGWVHVKSERAKPGSEKAGETAHRLYLNTDSKDIYKMVSAMIDAYDEAEIPFYFKYDDGEGKRDDTVVIYCSEEDLEKNLAILQKVKEANPDLVDRAHKPAVLAGKLDGWIGYGAHPKNDGKKERESYSSLRGKLLEAVLNEEGDKVINDIPKGQLLEATIQKKIEGDREILEIGRKKGITEERMQEMYGFGYNDLDNPSSNYRQRLLSEYQGGKVDALVRKAAVELKKKDPSFRDNVRAGIRRRSEEFGIDPENFCQNK